LRLEVGRFLEGGNSRKFRNRSRPTHVPPNGTAGSHLKTARPARLLGEAMFENSR